MADDIYTRNKDIVTRKIAGELFVVPVRGKLADMQRIFVLNTLGEFIWQQIGERKSLEDIRKDVVERFDVGEEIADSDIREFIAGLLANGLIRE
ncbi:MAG TPA: PqqD family protein [Thermodesulfovibrionales bacterium]|nr:PqqD family protein [Thermodesulfovibrionales bacterium]